MCETINNKYICEYCNNVFKRQCDLTRHINIVHLKTTIIHIKHKTKQCPKCKRQITICNFNKHLKSCGNKRLGHKDVQKILDKCIIKDNKYICSICNKEFTKFGIGTHIWRKHTNSGRQFDSLENRPNRHLVAWNKGLTKETDHRVANSSNTYKKNHRLGKHKKVVVKDKESWKKNISNGMKKAHKDGRAWNIGMSRWNNEPSFPEKFFMQVINNEFEDKNYIREMPFKKYSLDFAWPNKLKCIEIDGGQHERFEDYKKRDLEKDKLLYNNNWKVLRIKWSDMRNDTKHWIKIAKDFIDL